MKTPSVRTKLTLLNVGVLALALVLLGFGIFSGARASLLSSVDKDMSNRADRLAKRLQDVQFNPPRNEVHVRLEGVSGQSRPKLSVNFGRDGFSIDLKPVAQGQYGGVYVPTQPNDPTRSQFRPRMLDLAGKTNSGEKYYDADGFKDAVRGHRTFTVSTVDDEPIRVLSIPLTLNNKVVKVLQWPHPLAETYHALNGLTITMLLVMPAILLVAAVGGFYLTKRALQPVREITDTAAKVGAESLDGRLEVKGNDEFSRLSQTFNGMLERLQGAFQRMEKAVEQQRRFTADASHELRTPLTVIKANTSLALKGSRTAEEYKKTLAAVNAATDSMNRLVNDLLLLARSDSGLVETELEPVCLKPILKEAISSVARPGIAEIRLKLEDDGIEVVANGHALTRVFVNLLENAARYTAEDGHIDIEAIHKGDKIAVLVRDTGCGIDPEHLPHLLERFYRVDEARARNQGGSGLGLAICASIVESHGGKLEITSFPGQGTTVTITLPGAAPEQPA